MVNWLLCFPKLSWISSFRLQKNRPCCHVPMPTVSLAIHRHFRFPIPVAPVSPCAEDEFVVIGGQHSVEALRRLGAEMMAKKRDVPEVVSRVLARVMKAETPLQVRQYAAGDAQAAQTAVTERT